jgi:integrase
MPRRTLSDRYLKSLKPARDGQPYDADPDAIVPGLRPRVMGSGQVTFVLLTRYPGRPHPARRALGGYGELTLEQARNKARKWLGLIRQGIDPATEEEHQRQAELRKHKNTFEAVAEEYLRRAVIGKQRKGDTVARELRNEFISRWGSRPITAISRQDVLTVIDEAVDRGSKFQAFNLLGHVRRMFNWVISRGVYGIEHSPCDRMKPQDVIGRKDSRTRILSDLEIRALWRASGKLGYPWGAFYRLLLVTGQRKSEVAGARWSEIDLDKKTWTIPAERMKMANAHVVPLTDTAIEILKSLPEFRNPDYVFSTTFGKSPIVAFSKAKVRLDKAMSAELGAEPPPFVVHDIRRSVRTHLAALPIPPLVAERVIAHAKQGLDRVYNLHEYADEKRHALELWASRLRDIIEPPPANVVPIKASA